MAKNVRNNRVMEFRGGTDTFLFPDANRIRIENIMLINIDININSKNKKIMPQTAQAKLKLKPRPKRKRPQRKIPGHGIHLWTRWWGVCIRKTWDHGTTWRTCKLRSPHELQLKRNNIFLLSSRFFFLSSFCLKIRLGSWPYTNRAGQVRLFQLWKKASPLFIRPWGDIWRAKKLCLGCEKKMGPFNSTILPFCCLAVRVCWPLWTWIFSSVANLAINSQIQSPPVLHLGRNFRKSQVFWAKNHRLLKFSYNIKIHRIVSNMYSVSKICTTLTIFEWVH